MQSAQKPEDHYLSRVKRFFTRVLELLVALLPLVLLFVFIYLADAAPDAMTRNSGACIQNAVATQTQPVSRFQVYVLELLCYADHL